MKIIVDENIPLADKFFADMAELKFLPGRQITAADVRDANALLVRSITKVDEELLAGTRISFVGSATIGMDHIDENYLQEQGVTYSNAPGCNADSVVQYVLSGLAALSLNKDFDWFKHRVGIVGHGNIGSRLKQCLEIIGVDCVACDPYLKGNYVDWQSILHCDVISFHTPLCTKGEHPTYHMLNEKVLEALPENKIIINTSRGAVVDNTALLKYSDKFNVILDVWENEPDINKALLRNIAIGTSHIAGYSLEGKCRGTAMIYQAFCKHFKLPIEKTLQQFMPEVNNHVLDLSAEKDFIDGLNRAFLTSYNIHLDNKHLNNMLVMDKQQQNGYFDKLRKNYPVRREYSVFTLNVSDEWKKLYSCLGFKVLGVDQ